MKNLRFIFTLIFLAGMLFTVFQYVPILEEETHSHRVEMAKKMKTDGNDGGNDSGEDNGCDDDDSEQDAFIDWNEFSQTFHTGIRTDYHTSTSFYKYLLEKKFTPPPKA